MQEQKAKEQKTHHLGRVKSSQPFDLINPILPSSLSLQYSLGQFPKILFSVLGSTAATLPHWSPHPQEQSLSGSVL